MRSGEVPGGAAVRRQPGHDAPPAPVAIVALEDMATIQRVTRLIDALWGTDRLVAPGLVRAISHAGGYAVAALADGEVVGASVAFLGLEATPDGPRTILHSHVTGVALPGRGIGAALKAHQRRWCADRGIAAVTWTFDPLVRRNGWFNVAKLGAVGTAYLVDHYGEMGDGINAGVPTDRLLARWAVDPVAGGHRSSHEVPCTTLLVVGPDGGPAAGEVPLPDHPAAVGDVVLPDGVALGVGVPEDIEGLRRTSPDVALRWRMAVRVTMGTAMAAGHRVTGMRRDGIYVLTPPRRGE